VLGLTRADGQYIGAPTGTTLIKSGGILVIYGREEGISALDRRLAGAAGDEAHRGAVRRHERVERDEHAASETSHRPDAA
jgi:hypothetical protein